MSEQLLQSFAQRIFGPFYMNENKREIGDETNSDE